MSKITATEVAIGAGIVGVGAAAWYFLRKGGGSKAQELPYLDANVLPVEPGTLTSWGREEPAYTIPPAIPPVQPQTPPVQYEPPENKNAQPDDRNGMGEPKEKTVEQVADEIDAAVDNQAQANLAAQQAEQRQKIIAAMQQRLIRARDFLAGKGWKLSDIKDPREMGPVDEALYGTHATEIFKAFGVDPGSQKPVIAVRLMAIKNRGTLTAILVDNTGLTKFKAVLAKPKITVPEYAPKTQTPQETIVTAAASGGNGGGGFEDQMAQTGTAQDQIVTTSASGGGGFEDQVATTTATTPSVATKPKPPVEALKEILAQFRTIGLCLDTRVPWARLGRLNPALVAAEWMRVQTLNKKFELGKAWTMAVGAVDGDKARVRYIYTLKANPKMKIVLKRC